MDLLRNPPRGATVENTLDGVVITLPPPPPQPVLLTAAFQLVGYAGVAAAGWLAWNNRDPIFGALTWLISASAAFKPIDRVADVVLADPNLTGLVVGMMVFSVFSSMIESVRKSAEPSARAIVSGINPPRAPVIRIEPHRVSINEHVTPLHALDQPQDAAGYADVAKGQSEAIQRWLVDLIEAAKQQRAPSSTDDIPEPLRKLRQQQKT